MSSNFRYLVYALLTVCLVSGCYSKPVRHLASDVALIKVGESSREDVLTFLGEPDEQTIIGEGVEKWVYTEQDSSILQDAPVLGKYLGKPDYGTVTVILKDNIAIECVYGAYDEDAMDWAEDFRWQEKRK